MTHNRASVSPWAIRGLYFFTFILFFWPGADLITNVWPPQPSNIQWRYGFMGLLAGFLHTPVLGLVLAMSLAYVMKHRRTLLTLSAINLIGAAGLLAVLLFFALDVVQLGSTVPAESQTSFRVGSLIAELKHFTSFLALMLLGIGGWKTATAMGTRSAKDSSQPAVIMTARPG